MLCNLCFLYIPSMTSLSGANVSAPMELDNVLLVVEVCGPRVSVAIVDVESDAVGRLDASSMAIFERVSNLFLVDIRTALLRRCSSLVCIFNSALFIRFFKRSLFRYLSRMPP